MTEYVPVDFASVFIGGEYYADRTHTDRPGYFDGSKRFQLDRYAGFLQADIQSRFGRFTAGARYEHQEHTGGAFVPRLGYTWVSGDFHLKLLANQAFRAPIMENIKGPFGDSGIDPETTTIFEAEAGYRLTDSLFFIGNIYHITIEDPIIWAPTGYSNLDDKSGTYGFETELRYVHRLGSVKASYSFSTVAKNTADPYESDAGKDTLVGMPAHIFAVLATWRPNQSLSLSTTFHFIDEVQGYRVAEADYRGDYGPYYVLGINLRYMNLFIDGLEARFAVHDLLNEAPRFVQPYRGDGPPLPGPSREYTLSLVFGF